MKLKSLDKNLSAHGEIELYIELNRHNLPKEKEWDELLVKMVHELLSVGWNSDMSIYTKMKFGAYELDSRTPNNEIHKKVFKIFSKYLEIYETGDYIE